MTEHHLEFLSLKGGCTGSSESTLVKMPHCWKSHVTAQLCTVFRSFVLYVKKESTYELSFSFDLMYLSACKTPTAVAGFVV